MPIGPSHGSRGGGGGGRSFGGGGFSFGGGGSRHRHRDRSSSGTSLGGAIIGGLIYSAFADRRRRHFSRRYGYDPTPDEINSMPRRKAPTIFLILAIVVAFFSMITMTFRSNAVKNVNSYKETMSIMKDDYVNDYKPMIDQVASAGTPTGSSSIDCGNGYYKTIATFSTQKSSFYESNPTPPGIYTDFYVNGYEYCFIVYEYYDARTGSEVTATTYTQFSASQAQALNGKIEIAYYSKAGDESYSMNTSYNINTCAEYDYYEDLVESNKKSASTYLIAFIVELLIIAGLVALYVLKLKKYKKLVKQDEELLYQKRQAETQKAQAEAQEAQFDAQRKNRFCEYCGSQIDANTNTCSGCGARVSE